ncbi:GNAT family N-acetyltransferase [Tateyamaria omphalii]|uniref:N-acetyltransferase domain-containing protein n=1 Tax=Tateyamaria omphalii TaxID=299262 RepID=A0A1P8MU01_9RHOB|nr:GNAT family N-acetyltransferase [Tateyamaria omphalii]APX11419.1 hypothetical protein BWR18_06800 [Tateyamaria omphalii]
MARPAGAGDGFTAQDFSTLTLEPRPWVDVIVATLQEEPIGYAALQRTLDLQRAIKAMVLTDVYVIPQLRRQGIGRALIDGACLEAGLAGCRALFVQTGLGDADATALCRASGFVDRPALGPHLERAL